MKTFIRLTWLWLSLVLTPSPNGYNMFMYIIWVWASWGCSNRPFFSFLQQKNPWTFWPKVKWILLCHCQNEIKPQHLEEVIAFHQTRFAKIRQCKLLKRPFVFQFCPRGSSRRHLKDTLCNKFLKKSEVLFELSTFEHRSDATISKTWRD